MEDDVAELSLALERVLAPVVRQARGLAKTKVPLEAEMAASRIIGRWSRLEIVGQSEPGDFLGQALVGYLETVGTDDALALAWGVGMVGGAGSFVGAWRITERMEAVGHQRPAWSGPRGQTRLDEAWMATDVFGDQDMLVGRFSYEGDGPHDVALLIDRNLMGMVKDIAVHPASHHLRDRWERARDIVVRDITDREFSDRVDDALRLLDMTWLPTVNEDAYLLRPLVDARRLHLPRPKPLKRRTISRAARDRLYREFRTSEVAATLGRTTDLARWAIDFAADYHDDPLRWSPVVVELFLADWLPGKVNLEADEVEALPGVLRAWLRFVGQKRSFEARLVAEMLAAVDAYEADFRDAMADSSRFGFAKSLGMQMQEDGVDLTDDAAVQAWVEAFNALPQEERIERTGGPRLH
jgi:hypothetical protein